MPGQHPTAIADRDLARRIAGKLISILTALAAIALLPGIVADEISKSVFLIANPINSQP